MSGLQNSAADDPSLPEAPDALLEALRRAEEANTTIAAELRRYRQALESRDLSAASKAAAAVNLTGEGTLTATATIVATGVVNAVAPSPTVSVSGTVRPTTSGPGAEAAAVMRWFIRIGNIGSAAFGIAELAKWVWDAFGPK